MHIYVHICIYMYVYIYVYVCIYIYTHDMNTLGMYPIHDTHTVVTVGVLRCRIPVRSGRAHPQAEH